MKIIYLAVLPIMSLSVGVALLLRPSEKVSSAFHRGIFGGSTKGWARVVRTLFRVMFALVDLALVISSFVFFIFGLYAD